MDPIHFLASDWVLSLEFGSIFSQFFMQKQGGGRCGVWVIGLYLGDYNNQKKFCLNFQKRDKPWRANFQVEEKYH